MRGNIFEIGCLLLEINKKLICVLLLAFACVFGYNYLVKARLEGLVYSYEKDRMRILSWVQGR